MVTYYNFANALRTEVVDIITFLGVSADDSNIIFKSPNYDVYHFDKYYNIFNKPDLYSSAVSLFTLSGGVDLGILIDDMQADLDYLKIIDKELYDQVIREFLSGSEDLSSMRDRFERAPNDLSMTYLAIFQKLGNFRNNTIVYNNEYNVLISQLYDDKLADLIGISMGNVIRNDLLYYIGFWDMTHKLRNDVVGKDRSALLHGSFNDIYKVYVDIRARATYHAFEEVDIASFSIDDIKRIFINDLYKAYISNTRFGDAFDFLSGKGVHFDSFRGYENYIAAITDKNQLIEWYEAIRKAIYPSIVDGGSNQVGPNPNPVPANPEIPQIKINRDIFYDIVGVMQNKEIPDPSSIYADSNDLLGYIRGSWMTLSEKYPDLFKYIEERAFNGNFVKYAGKHKTTVRNDVIEIARKILNGVPINPIHESSDIPINLRVFQDIEMVMNNRNIENLNIIFTGSDEEENLVIGSWNTLVDRYGGLMAILEDKYLDGDFINYVKTHKDTARDDVIRFARDYLENNPLDPNMIKSNEINPNSNPNQGQINPNPGQVNPNQGQIIHNPLPLAQGIRITQVVLDDVIKIMKDENIPLDPHNDNYIPEQVDLAVVMSSWFTLYEKYEDLCKYIESYFGVEKFENHVLKKPWEHMVEARDEVIEVARKLFEFNQAVKEGIFLIEDQFNEIRMIFENNAIYSKNAHKVVSDSLLRLYGSWDLFEERYPNVAGRVIQFLFAESGDLFNYAISVGDNSNGFMPVRQNIIDFIRTNFYKGSVEVKESLKINGKDVSECSIDEVEAYVLNRILTSKLSPQDSQRLINEVDTVYRAYIQFINLMVSSNIPEDKYLPKYDQFKNSLLKVLDAIGGPNPVFIGIKSIMENKNLPCDMTNVISANSKYIAFLGSMQKFEKDYPQFAKVVMEKIFKNNPDNIDRMFYRECDDALRQRIIDFVSRYISENNIAQGQGAVPGTGSNSQANPIPNKFKVFQEPVTGADINKIKEFMADAVVIANTFVEQIRVKDNDFATKLSNQIDALYKKYLVHVESSNHQYQYMDFIKHLNEVFDKISPADYLDNTNHLKTFLVKKVSTSNFNLEKFTKSMSSALADSYELADEIGKKNKFLAKRICDQAFALYEKYMSDTLSDGDTLDVNYELFVKALNKLMIVSIEMNKAPK